VSFSPQQTEMKRMETKASFTFKLQSPKAMNTVYAEAGLLTYSPFARPSRRVLSGQWLRMGNGFGAYSCGTVTELHRIPF
jgi:hypothetical protein